MYDFDKIIDRRNTDSSKVDRISMNQLPEDTLSLWVADMDFQTAPEITEALRTTVDHGIFGYSMVGEGYQEAVEQWFLRRFDWKTDRAWMIQTPGVVFALSAAVRAYTKPEDGVLIQRPVYYPFSKLIEQNGRKLVNSPLAYRDGSYSIDLEDFERQIIEQQVKLFILCNPHNPVGRVWTREELLAMGEICLRHGVFVISDEIHCDFIRPGYTHINFATLSPKMEQNCMICTSPSKTFNLAGLQLSNIFIPNEEKRKAYAEYLQELCYQEPGLFGIRACQAAYRKGEPWLTELLSYLEGNLAYIDSYVKEHLPKLHLIQPQGTYLLWLDASAYGYTQEQMTDRLQHQARLWLDQGEMFGPEGAGFLRLNMASPRSIIAEAMDRFKLL